MTLSKRWSWRGDAYASGAIDRIWFDVEALDLVPLPLGDRGIWELNETYQPFGNGPEDGVGEAIC